MPPRIRTRRSMLANDPSRQPRRRAVQARPRAPSARGHRALRPQAGLPAAARLLAFGILEDHSVSEAGSRLATGTVIAPNRAAAKVPSPISGPLLWLTATPCPRSALSIRSQFERNARFWNLAQLANRRTGVVHDCLRSRQVSQKHRQEITDPTVSTDQSNVNQRIPDARLPERSTTPHPGRNAAKSRRVHAHVLESERSSSALRAAPAPSDRSL